MDMTERTVKSPAVWISQQIEAENARRKAAKERERRAAATFHYDGGSTKTHHHVRIGHTRYEVVHYHEGDTWRVYSLARNSRTWLETGTGPTPTAKRVLKALKEHLSKSSI